MISVIVPIYNTALYLEECINSVINQTYIDWELILVDDGSTDSSPSICDKYVSIDSRIKAIHINNVGLSGARNNGLEIAHGDYICFLDSDDYLFDYSLEILHKVLTENSAEVAVGNLVSDKYSNKKNKNGINQVILYKPSDAIADTLYQKNLQPSVCGKLFKKKLFDDLRFQESTYYEDLNIFYRLYHKSLRIAYIPLPVYYYRKTPGSILHTWNYRRLHVLNVTKRIEDFIKNNYPELIKAAQDRRLSANFNIFSLAFNNKEFNIADECWDTIKTYRLSSFYNKEVRLKNKLGILLSFLGKRNFGLLARFYYKD